MDRWSGQRPLLFKASRQGLAALLGSLLIGASAVPAQDAGQPASAAAIAAGKVDYDHHCAQCHGTNAKGSGPEIDLIPGLKPPDLTRLAVMNGGRFPAQRVADTIDGRKAIPSHKRFDMPFWGVNFQESGKEFTPESEAKAKARIDAIVAYIGTLQTK